MINVFVEASCNRYVQDKFTFCHVYDPLNKIQKLDWHLTPEQAQAMTDKILKWICFNSWQNERLT